MSFHTNIPDPDDCSALWAIDKRVAVFAQSQVPLRHRTG
jgi:hypothetical protein